MLRPSWFAVTRSGLPSPFRSPSPIQRGRAPVATVLERRTRGTEAAASDATPSARPAAEHASKAEPRLGPIGRFRPANARAIFFPPYLFRSARRSCSTGPVMLLCLSSLQRRSVFEEPVEAAGEVALEAAGRFASTLAFLDATVDVGDRLRVCATSGDEDHVQGSNTPANDRLHRPSHPR